MAKKDYRLRQAAGAGGGGRSVAADRPALGQRGLDVVDTKAFNAQTQKLEKGAPIPVTITVYADRSFTSRCASRRFRSSLKKAAKRTAPRPPRSDVGQLG